MTADETIKELEKLLDKSIALTIRALKLSKEAFWTGFYAGVAIAYFTVLIAKWYYS